MSLFSILNNVGLGSALGNLQGMANSSLSSLGKSASGGLGGLLGAGALGALLGTVLPKNVLKSAALVGAGAVAWNFYKKWAQKKNAQSDAAVEDFTNTQPKAIAEFHEDTTAMLLLRAMVFAAKADGHIDSSEQERITKVVQEMFPGQDTSQLLSGLMNEPLEPASLAAQVQSFEQGEDVYRLSCLIVNIDHFMERSYLDQLAQALGIQASRKAELEMEADEAREKLAQM